MGNLDHKMLGCDFVCYGLKSSIFVEVDVLLPSGRTAQTRFLCGHLILINWAWNYLLYERAIRFVFPAEMKPGWNQHSAWLFLFRLLLITFSLQLSLLRLRPPRLAFPDRSLKD